MFDPILELCHLTLPERLAETFENFVISDCDLLHFTHLTYVLIHLYIKAELRGRGSK
jgi:hypothetical protein